MKLRWESQDGNWDIFGISFVGTTSNWEAACLIKLLISILYKCYSILSGCASGFYLSGTPKTSVYHISELSISNWAQVWWCFWCLSYFSSFEQLGVLDSKHLYRLQTLASTIEFLQSEGRFFPVLWRREIAYSALIKAFYGLAQRSLCTQCTNPPFLLIQSSSVEWHHKTCVRNHANFTVSH